MSRACHGPIRAAVTAIGGTISDDEIDNLMSGIMAEIDYAKIERGVANRLRRMEAGVTPEQIRAIVAQQTRNAMKDGLIARQVKAFAKLAADRREIALAAMPNTINGKAFDAADKVRAYNTGSEKLGLNLGFSAEAEGKGRFMTLMSPLDAEIEHSGAKGMFDPLFNKPAREAFEDKVAQEIARANGADIPATGDKFAEGAGRAFAKALERGRLMQNEVGAWIDKLPGYIAKQNHDALKVAGGFWNLGDAGKLKAFNDWADFIRPLLDETTFKDLADYDLDADVLARNGGDRTKAFLESVWSNIVYSSRIGDAGKDFEYEFKTPAGKAKSVSRARTLHFKDPSSWLSYHRQYGQGSLYSVIVSQLEGAARNSAIMNRWGPNPDAAFEAHITRAEAEARTKGGPAASSTVNKLKGQGLESLSGNLHHEWEILTGKAGAPADLRIAAFGNVIRLDQRLSKLGGAVLASLGPDQAIAAQTMRKHGGTFLEGYQGAFGGVLRLNRDAQKEIGDMMGVGARAAASDISTRFDAGDGVSGLGSGLTNMLFKVTGFTGVMEGHRRGLAAMWSMFAAKQGANGFDALEPAFKGQLERFGVTAAEWEKVRGNTSRLSDGNTYLHFDGLEPELGLKMRSYMAQFLDDSLTEPGVREQAKLTFGTKRGDILGEAVRCFTQFKAFPITYITRHLNPAIDALKAGDKGAIMNMAHLILASTLFGYVSLQAKQISKGLTPRPLTDENGDWRSDIWIASLMQGGGLGIYGDFLFGNYSRAGGVVETLSGPSVGEFANITKLMSKVVRADQYDDNTLGDVAADSVKAIKSNTPFLNVWFLRAAMDSAIMHYVQEPISPGYTERYQQRLRDEQGTGYLLKPAN